MNYLFVIIATLAIGLGAQALIKATYRKWNKVPVPTGLTGAQAARKMLDANGLYNVQIKQIPGELSDNFDPQTNVVSLSRDIYASRSVAATAVACHECGHAVQHACGYTPGKVRTAIVPVVNFASNLWIFVLMIGIFMQMLGLIYVAIILYVAVIAFQLVTLPVELNASSRALSYIDSYVRLPQEQYGGARSVLTAAALTYVAAALASLLNLLWLLGMARNN
ncbi:MAG: zinc metallopeptidase [Coriobacteriales bacterium]|jgi:Zn-dependent membrane protease YugP|nr:zinc metallopeptidase [Coriobacteriales bacterium]